MDQLASPDLPAWSCYLVVLLAGMLAARSQVNELLATQTDRWRFHSTWILFSAHLLIPVILFWFLDFTSALHDTSLFGALVVALGYRQIFAGGVQGIQMAGQTPQLWQPFAAWVKRVQTRIETDQRRYTQDLEERMRTYVSADQTRIDTLEKLVTSNTTDAAALAAALTAVRDLAAPPNLNAEGFKALKARETVIALLNDLRTSQPEQTPQLLNRSGLEDPRLKLVKFWRSPVLTTSLFVLVMSVLTGGAIYTLLLRDGQLDFHQWRFVKAHATEWDRYRTERFLSDRLQASSNDPEAVRGITQPLLDRLHFKDVNPDYAERLLRLIVNSHSPKTTPPVIPALIECLRTENADVRLRVKLALIQLRDAEYPGSALSEETEKKWVPTKDESPGQVDAHVREFSRWWRSQTSSVK